MTRMEAAIINPRTWLTRSGVSQGAYHPALWDSEDGFEPGAKRMFDETIMEHLDIESIMFMGLIRSSFHPST